MTVTFLVSTWFKHMTLIHRNVKNTIIMFQCKTYLNTCFVWIIMLVRLSVEVDMFSVFPYYGLEKEKTIFFDIKCHNSYLMKCLHNNISQNDTICWHLYLPHLVSNIKTPSSQCYTNIFNIIKNFNSYRRETLWQVSSYRRRTLYLWFCYCKTHL